MAVFIRLKSMTTMLIWYLGSDHDQRLPINLSGRFDEAQYLLDLFFDNILVLESILACLTNFTIDLFLGRWKFGNVWISSFGIIMGNSGCIFTYWRLLWVHSKALWMVVLIWQWDQWQCLNVLVWEHQWLFWWFGLDPGQSTVCQLDHWLMASLGLSRFLTTSGNLLDTSRLTCEVYWQACFLCRESQLFCKCGSLCSPWNLIWNTIWLLFLKQMDGVNGHNGLEGTTATASVA